MLLVVDKNTWQWLLDGFLLLILILSYSWIDIHFVINNMLSFIDSGSRNGLHHYINLRLYYKHLISKQTNKQIHKQTNKQIDKKQSTKQNKITEAKMNYKLVSYASVLKKIISISFLCLTKS